MGDFLQNHSQLAHLIHFPRISFLLPKANPQWLELFHVPTQMCWGGNLNLPLALSTICALDVEMTSISWSGAVEIVEPETSNIDVRQALLNQSNTEDMAQGIPLLFLRRLS